MKKELVITDLTRMYHGNVCIAGYGNNKVCIRPILEKAGISEKTLIVGDKAIIYPFAVVEFDLQKPQPQKPHTEDYIFVPGSPRFIRQVENREKVLAWSLFGTINSIFDQTIYDDYGFYVMDCQGARSLGTIIPKQII